MNTIIRKNKFGMYTPNSTPARQYILSLISIVSDVENKFYTKIYDCGVANRESEDFKSLIPFGVTAPYDANYIYYLLVPIDDASNIITNDYYEMFTSISKAKPFTPDYVFALSGFTRILQKDWHLCDYLERTLKSNVYAIGSLRVKKYMPNDNLVNDADKIEDLRYRFIRFFSL